MCNILSLTFPTADALKFPQTLPFPQVPLLLGLGEEERALGAALDSGDADLAHLALFRMQRSLPLPQLLAALAALENP